ncbi:FAD:protein FMN transferase [Candidatus Saccharibacteria bacterium]|nr:MAG: FAD:protein FMN transferase [Candidatus Saccharibacteria bacterium]
MKHSTKFAAKPKSNIQLDFEAIGTMWAVQLAAPAEHAQRISKLIADRISLFDRTYSRFRPDSWVQQCSQPSRYRTPADFAPLFELYQQLNELTDGAVTPLIGDVLERAGYDQNYSLEPKALQQIPSMPEALELIDNTLHVKYKVCLDFGAAGKGYLVDIIAALLIKEDITEFYIDAGGDIYHNFPTPTPVGLEDPADSTKVVGIAKLQAASLCGSAGNRRQWAGLHHIFDPRSLQPTDTIEAVWVLIPHSSDITYPTMLADGLSTALFFSKPSLLENSFAFEYVILSTDKSAYTSKHFPGGLA